MWLAFAENNLPNKPIFLMGHGLMAALLVNYATWSEAKNPTGGYILLSPLLDSRSDRAYINESAIEKILDVLTESKKRRFLFASEESVSVRMKQFFRDALPNGASEFSSEYLKACMPTNVRDQLRAITSPFCLWVGSNDSLVHSTTLISDVSQWVTGDSFKV